MASEEKSTDFGTYLRNYRRSKSIPLETVTQKTKIRAVVLRQIESGDLNQMPSPIAKGFIRAYAEAVGADVQESLRRYETSCTMRSQSEQFLAPPARPRHVMWRRLLPAVVVFAGLIAGTLYVAGRMHRDDITVPQHLPMASEAMPAAPVGAGEDAAASRDIMPREETFSAPQPNSAEKTILTRPEADLPAVESAAAPDEPAATSLQASGERLAEAAQEAPAAVDSETAKWVLQLRATEMTWLKVVRDDAPSREITMYPDDQVTLEANDKFELLIGNAGGIRLTLNDEPVPIPAESGKVVKLQLPR